MFKKVESQVSFPKMEEEILKFWDEKKIFEKSVSQREGKPLYSFYDGPPFANGTPHHGHLLASTSKDVVPRYWTMKGLQVPRRWGWDTHGLPVESIVEKRLGYKNKREIENDIEHFNAECRASVFESVDAFRSIVRRIGRFVDFENSYKTLDSTYMESVWWAFKTLYDKGLVYEDKRISLFCPHCSTPLSNFEIAMDNAYREDTDPSVYVKFPVKEKDFSLLAWTTTPWTLLANVAVAIHPDLTYVVVQVGDEKLVVAEEAASRIFGEEGKILEEIPGTELIGLRYEPLFPHDLENGYRVVAGDFITATEGTGLAHEAPAYGEEDFVLRKKENLPLIENIDDEGRYTEGEWKGEKVWKANEKVIGHLESEGRVFRKENITHSYPHCYRCNTKLIYKAQDAWFINIEKLRPELLALNEEIDWQPEHLKHGRFGKGLETAPDWNISRSRYWGTVMPVWRCAVCNKITIVGSYDELKELSGKSLEDYHRPYIDEVTFSCECGKGTMMRIKDVFDCWVESGSMPFASVHYPFENKEIFEAAYPAQFISEYIAQTRGWFYTLHVMSVALFGKESFMHAVTTGTIAGKDGRKMSKSYGNYTDPQILLDRYGADAFRLYLMQSPLMEGENLNFNDKELEDIVKGPFRMLWNSYSFFTMYASIDNWQPNTKYQIPNTSNILDRWILSELQLLIQEVGKAMDDYELSKATRAFMPFIDNLSNWYIRRSRKRFWKSEDDNDKENAYQTLYDVLVTLSKVMAPFTPFLSEEIYKNLTNKESVHLADWPTVKKELIDEKLNEEMKVARNVVTHGLALRTIAKVKVRQPLSGISIQERTFRDEIGEIIKEELNVKNITTYKTLAQLVELNTEVTPELKLEGEAREIIRAIQEGRKKAKFNVEDRIVLGYQGKEKVFEKFGDLIAKEILAISVENKDVSNAEYCETVEIDGEPFSFSLKRA
ncbi:MAG: isoleucine--tRNA ligase [bacterium]|nr:isoleucine--tRNA ligase [bacterium]